MSQGATALVEIPETRYAKTLDGGYIAYKLFGDSNGSVRPTEISAAKPQVRPG